MDKGDRDFGCGETCDTEDDTDGSMTVVIEPPMMTDIFATGLLPPEDRGEFVRIRATVEGQAASGGGQTRQVVARIAFPRAAFFQALFQMMDDMLPGAGRRRRGLS